MKIKDLSRVDLPREKFEKYGPDKLHDFELLAILLGSGIKDLNVLELSKKVIKIISKIGATNTNLTELRKIRGLGKAKAISILSAIEFARRIDGAETSQILTPEVIWNMCSTIHDSKREHFIVFYLNTQKRLIEQRTISIGTLESSLVHPREVFEPAISLHAAGIILVHNHPSGNLEPSAEDCEVTKRLAESGKILGIELVDHLIIGRSWFLSFKQKLLL